MVDLPIILSIALSLVLLFYLICRGLLSVFDCELLLSKNPTGTEKGASAYNAAKHAALLLVISKVPDASMLVKAPLSGRLCTTEW